MIAYRGRVRPKGEPFLRVQAYERVGILLVEVYERVGKSVISISKRANRHIFMVAKSREKRSGFVIYSYFKDSSFTAIKSDAKFYKGYMKGVPFVNRRYMNVC